VHLGERELGTRVGDARLRVGVLGRRDELRERGIARAARYAVSTTGERALAAFEIAAARGERQMAKLVS